MVSCKKTLRECFKKFVLAPASSRSASEKNIAISRISREVFPQPKKKSAVRPLPRVGDPNSFLSASQDKMDMVFLSA